MQCFPDLHSSSKILKPKRGPTAKFCAGNKGQHRGPTVWPLGRQETAARLWSPCLSDRGDTVKRFIVFTLTVPAGILLPGTLGISLPAQAALGRIDAVPHWAQTPGRKPICSAQIVVFCLFLLHRSAHTYRVSASPRSAPLLSMARCPRSCRELQTLHAL